MRIAIAVSDLRTGGAERNAVNYALSLAQRGHEVSLVAGAGALSEELRGSTVRQVRVRARLRRPWEVLATSRAVRALARNDGLDIVHCFMSSSAVAARLARTPNTSFKIVTSPPGSVQDLREPQSLSRLRLRLLARSSDLILSPSEPFRKMLLDGGVPESRIMDLQFNAIPFWRYGSPSEDGERIRRELGIEESAPVASSIARLHPVKQVDLFIRAMPLILRDLPTARFIVAGDGPVRNNLESMANKLGVTAAIRFTGDRQDVAALLSATDVFVQTTAGWGGPGLSMIEALAASRPVVCVAAGDRVSALRSSEGVIFVPDQDVAALAARATELLRDRPVARSMGIRGRTWAQRRFDLDEVTTQLEIVYARLGANP